MRDDQIERFTAVLNGVLDIYGKERPDTAIALWIKLLEPFDLGRVEDALVDHCRTSRFAPAPADVISRIQGADGRPTADEAWAMIPRAESESVIWTDEMSAGYAVAAPLLEAGDAIAARRAFIDRYTAAVANARRSGAPIKVWPSWGWDAGGRIAAVDKALAVGLLTHERANQLRIAGKPSGAPPDFLPTLKLV